MSKTICVLFFVAALVTSQVSAHKSVGRGTHPLDWHTNQVYAATSGGVNDGPAGTTTYIGDRHCMTGSALNIDILDDYAFDIDETVEIEIEFYLDGSNNKIELWYDANASKWPPFSILGQTFKFTLPAYSPGQQFYTKTFSLKRARFAGLGHFKSDLHIMPFPYVGQREVTVCNIVLKRSYTSQEPQHFGRLFLEVIDENKRITPVRIGIYDQTGRMPLPSNEAVTIKWREDVRKIISSVPVSGGAWPHSNHRFFYIDGSYHTVLPEGTYDIVVSHGMEYRIWKGSVNIKGGKTHPVKIHLDRWQDMPDEGWYSGDTHIHYGRHHTKDDNNIWTHLAAEDIHISNLLEMGNVIKTLFKQYNWGETARVGSGTHFLAPGQEDPRTARLGHTIQLNLTEPVRFAEQYYLYHKVFREVKRQGGLTAYAHVADSGFSFFNARGGLALDVPFGLVDLIEVMEWAGGANGTPWVTDLWFDFLNLGYKLTPIAGSDYMDFGVPGEVRTYVYLGGSQFSVRSWFDALKAGRSFVTSGPMLDFTVNNHGPGTELAVTSGAQLMVKANASLMPDIGLLSKLELYEQGRLVATTVSSAGEETLALEYKTAAMHGTWFVLLAYGKENSPESSLAATAPVYISVDGSGFCNPSAIEDIVEKMTDNLNSILDGRFKERANWETSGVLKDIDAEQIQLLQKRILTAQEIYADIASEASRGGCAIGR